MDLTSSGHFMFNYKSLVLEEIALEGLEGIGIRQLCRHIESRISAPVTEKMRARFWNFVVNSQSISVYILGEPLELYNVTDRFELVHEESGHLLDTEFYLDGPYEFSPVENDYGSCKNYNSRALIPQWQLQELTYVEAMANYGDTLVMVASIEDRWQALAPHMPIPYLTTMSPIQYCILELVGKGRKNGQMTVGNTNLLKIVKEPKLMFYNKKYLKDYDFIRDQCVTHYSQNKSSKSLLIHLKRFHTPHLMPKSGRLYELVKYLSTKPDYSEKTDVILRMGILTAQKIKKLQKNVNIFRFEDRYEEGISKHKLKSGELVKKKYITFMDQSEESSQSDCESNEEPLKCQYQVGVTLLRQAYEAIRGAGLSGLTQIDISQILGIEFYSSRTICRVFKKNGVVREFLEDKGKQRMARYIAVASTSEMDKKFESEKKKLREFLNQSQQELSLKRSITDPEDEVPLKKFKTDNENNSAMDAEDVDSQVIELEKNDDSKFNRSFIKGGNSLTLRQLRFANGLLKIVWDRTIVSGYLNLSTLVAKEIGDTPMDTKSLKRFVQRLVTDGQLRILKMKWPGYENQYSILICVPHIKTTDKIIKDKYKELCMKILTKKTETLPQDVKNKPRPVTQLSFPRYLRFQKLHEFIFDCTYINKIENKFNDLPDGFTSLVDVIPELTVQFALGNINNVNEINAYNISDDILHLKLSQAPPELYKIIAQSKSFKNALRESLKNLSALGLIQLIKPKGTKESYGFTLTCFTFYVNRHAKVINTAGEWPRENANVGTITKSFYFETMADVNKYWATVQHISVSTTVNLPSQDRKTKLPAPTRTPEEAMSSDNGKCFGNGRGPCGFDSSFYMEINRLWHTYQSKCRMVQNRVRIIPEKRMKKVRKPKLKAKVTKRSLTATKAVNKCRRKSRKEPIVKWLPIEDKVITFSKAALTIMSPTVQPGYLTLRNGVAKDILGVIGTKDINQNVANAIHKRANTLESNADMVLLKEQILCLLRGHKNLVDKYEHSLKQIRVSLSANMVKYITEAKIVVFELIWIIIQLLKRKSDDLPCVAADLEEFHRNFTLSVKPSINRLNSFYKTVNDPILSTLKESVIMSVTISNESAWSKESAKKVFNIFQHYPERLLRTAVDQLRKCSAISAKEKIMNNHLDRLNVPEMVRSSYKASFIYKKKLTCKLNSGFVDDLSSLTEKDVFQNSVKGNPDINCFLLENQACDVLDLYSATTPVISGSVGSLVQVEHMNVIDMEANYKLKSGTIGIKPRTNIKNFAELYQNIDVESVVQKFFSNPLFVPKANVDCDANDPVIEHLKEKAEKGSTFKNIQETCGLNEHALIERLSELELKQVIRKVGYYENLLVLTEYTKPWSVEMNKKKRIIPMPWLCLKGTTNLKVFIDWAGLVLDKVTEFPYCSISYLAETCEFLTAKSCQHICEFLEKFKLLTLAVMKVSDCDLFFEDLNDSEFLTYNPYESFDNICIYPAKDSYTKFSYLRKCVLRIHCK